MGTIILHLQKKIGRVILPAILILGLLSGVTAQTTPGPITKDMPGTPAQTTNGNGVNIGFFYPVSSNGIKARQYTNTFSLNLLVGVSAAETGFTAAGLSNVIIDSASGLQIAGFSNHIGGCARGTQVAGFMNYIHGNAAGLQLAGFLNITGSSGGAGVAGFGNISTGGPSRIQVAGFINAAGNVNTQVAGFINIARKVKGVQVAGLINIADSSDYPIGIINIIKNGEKEVGISTDETLTTLASFRSGGRKLYGIAGLGYNNRGSRQLAAWEAGIGAHLYKAESFRLNAEIVGLGLTDFKNGDCQRASLRVLPALRLTRHIEIFAGPSFNHVYCNKGQGKDLLTHYLWSENNNKGDFSALYFGFTGGFQIRI